MRGSVPDDHVLSGEPWWDDADASPVADTVAAEAPASAAGPGTSAAGVPTTAGRLRGARAWWPLLGLLAIALLAAGLAVYANGSSAGPGPTAGAYISTPGLLATVAPDQRVAGPRLRGRLLDGAAFDSAGWAGDIVVVNFWGSWCPPCRAETPELVRVADTTRADGVRFLGVDIRDNRASAQAFTRAYRVRYPSLFDPDSQVGLAFRGLPPNAVPTTFVLDRRGRIAARALGRITAAQLTAVLTTLRGESP